MKWLRQYGLYICFFLLALAMLFIWLHVFAKTRVGELKVAILDIGQGDSIYIQSPTGVEVLIDGGPDASVLRELPKVMAYGDRTIDAVIATHQDADHIGGLVDLIPRYEIKNFIEPGIPKSTATALKMEQEVDVAGIPRAQAYRGMWLDLGGGARLDILFPDFDVKTLSEDKGNDGCVMAHLVYKNTSALFTCDAPQEVEDHLIAISTSTDLKSDVLKVGHHGSKYSSSNEWLDAVAPEFAAISVGAHNRYGHPTQETLGRLAAHNIPTYRTDEAGTIVFVSNGEVFIKK
ncbi:MAG: ComEC/Rec2 family competence protein [Patescibacteria group bacterium]